MSAPESQYFRIKFSCTADIIIMFSIAIFGTPLCAVEPLYSEHFHFSEVQFVIYYGGCSPLFRGSISISSIPLKNGKIYYHCTSGRRLSLSLSSIFGKKKDFKAINKQERSGPVQLLPVYRVVPLSLCFGILVS